MSGIEDFYKQALSHSNRISGRRPSEMSQEQRIIYAEEIREENLNLHQKSPRELRVQAPESQRAYHQNNIKAYKIMTTEEIIMSEQYESRQNQFETISLLRKIKDADQRARKSKIVVRQAS